MPRGKEEHRVHSRYANWVEDDHDAGKLLQPLVRWLIFIADRTDEGVVRSQVGFAVVELLTVEGLEGWRGDEGEDEKSDPEGGGKRLHRRPAQPVIRDQRTDQQGRHNGTDEELGSKGREAKALHVQPR